MAEPREPKTLRAGRLAWAPLALPLAVFLLLPILALALSSDPDEVFSRLADPIARDAMRLSAWTSGLAALICVVFGTPLAYVLARGRFPGKKLADALVDLPIVLPPAVAGIALLLAFGRRGPIGGMLEDLGWGLSFTSAAVVLAQVFVAAPLFVRSFAGALEQVERELEEAAILDGAGPLAVARRVVFPIAAGALLGPGSWRVRRDDPLCRQLPRAHPDHAARNLHRLRAGLPHCRRALGGAPGGFCDRARGGASAAARLAQKAHTSFTLNRRRNSDAFGSPRITKVSIPARPALRKAR
jgi:ABC-type sulfate transport system permease component